MLNNFYLDIELPKSSPKTVLNITDMEEETTNTAQNQILLLGGMILVTLRSLKVEQTKQRMIAILALLSGIWDLASSWKMA